MYHNVTMYDLSWNCKILVVQAHKDNFIMKIWPKLSKHSLQYVLIDSTTNHCSNMIYIDL